MNRQIATSRDLAAQRIDGGQTVLCALQLRLQRLALHAKQASEIGGPANQNAANFLQAEAKMFQRQNFIETRNFARAIETPVLIGPAGFDNSGLFIVPQGAHRNADTPRTLRRRQFEIFIACCHVHALVPAQSCP